MHDELLTTRTAAGTIAYIGGFMCPPEPFCFSLAQMAVFAQESLCLPGQFVHIARSRYGKHDFARNELAEKMLGDWLFFVDADHEFEPDLLSRLMTQMVRHNLDVVCGLYCYKDQSESPVLYMQTTGGDYEVIANFDKTKDLVKADSTGGGCLLIRRTVFERIKNELGQKPFSKIGGLGEDHSFCMRLKQLGIPLHCAWKIRAGHIRFDAVQWDEEGAEQRAMVAHTRRYAAGPIDSNLAVLNAR